MAVNSLLKVVSGIIIPYTTCSGKTFHNMQLDSLLAFCSFFSGNCEPAKTFFIFLLTNKNESDNMIDDSGGVQSFCWYAGVG